MVMAFKRKVSPLKHNPRPPITAQPREHIDAPHDITIQALASHPELLPRSFFTPTKKSKTKAHEDSCECDRCENASDIADLDFA